MSGNCQKSIDTEGALNMHSTSVGLFKDMLAIPFEATRLAYAQSVKLGLMPNSMLACRDFGRALSLAEKTALGPFARSR